MAKIIATYRELLVLADKLRQSIAQATLFTEEVLDTVILPDESVKKHANSQCNMCQSLM